jgi:uncharacterized tellurite resistance protein B-like protein
MGLFDSKEKKELISSLKILIMVVMADGKLDGMEQMLLKDKCEKAGFSFDSILKEIQKNTDNKLIFPDNFNKRLTLLEDAVKLMVIDGSITKEEYNMCVLIANSMGFSKEMVDQTINLIINNLKNNKDTEVFARLIETSYKALNL